jgi:hypothetical protein
MFMHNRRGMAFDMSVNGDVQASAWAGGQILP